MRLCLRSSGLITAQTKGQQPVLLYFPLHCTSVKRLPVFKGCSVIVKSTCDCPTTGEWISSRCQF